MEHLQEFITLAKEFNRLYCTTNLCAVDGSFNGPPAIHLMNGMKDIAELEPDQSKWIAHRTSNTQKEVGVIVDGVYFFTLTQKSE